MVRAIRSTLSIFRLGYLADVDVCPTGALTLRSWTGRGASGDVQRSDDRPSGNGHLRPGTDEIKSNDVTGRLRRGSRPRCGKWKAGNRAFYRRYRKGGHGARPAQCRIRDQESGDPVDGGYRDRKIKDEVLNEKVLSAIIEIKVKLERIPDFLQALAKVQKEVDTVISVGVASRCLSDGSLPHEAWVKNPVIPVTKRENQSGPGPASIQGDGSMTNTLHRQGKAGNLKEDYVVFMTTAAVSTERGVTRNPEVHAHL